MNVDRKKFLRSISLNYSYPNAKMNIKNFRQSSYNRWALSELHYYTDMHCDQSLEHSINDFRNMMDEFCCSSRAGTEANYMFSVAYDVASYAMDCLLAQNGGS